jgi:hypothetical protein
VSQEWNPAFKGPETLDTALDPLHRKIHTDIYAKATEGVYIPPDTSRPIDKFLQPNATIDERATTSSTEGARQGLGRRPLKLMTRQCLRLIRD